MPISGHIAGYERVCVADRPAHFVQRCSGFRIGAGATSAPAQGLRTGAFLGRPVSLDSRAGNNCPRRPRLSRIADRELRLSPIRAANVISSSSFIYVAHGDRAFDHHADFGLER